MDNNYGGLKEKVINSILQIQNIVLDKFEEFY